VAGVISSPLARAELATRRWIVSPPSGNARADLSFEAVQAVGVMVHFRLDPEKFLSLDEAWKRVCSRLGRYDEKAGRADEALARRGRALIGRSDDLGRRDRDLRKRIADETITDDERAAAEAELTKLAAVDHELAATEAVLNKKLAARTEKYAVEERRNERLLRDALADGLLDTWIEGPDGQPKCLLDREVESWRPAAFGAANIASIPDVEDPSFNPGPDTGGKPAFVEKPVFEEWLNAQQRETGEPGGEQTSIAAEAGSFTLVGEPAAVATVAESPAAPLEAPPTPDSLARPPSNKTMEEFVAAYIEKTRAAGKNPTQTGLWKAAQDALPGATRARLRTAFALQTAPPRRGRPRKK
jgi:hypothetical protein